MKKNFLVIVILFSFFTVKGQDENVTVLNLYEKKNEVKLNVVAPLFGAFEISYERILNKKSSLGVSALSVFNSKSSDDDLNHSISSYYRRYFGKKYASGFFVEGFGMLSSIDGKKMADTDGNLTLNEGSDVIDFSIGLGIGNKWVTKSGFVFEVNAGYGKLLFNANETDHTIVTRFGFSLGYRF
ncbi:DUF3575 domain-containing protein [Aquimarina longa]|uniref:DUF3575 domain-containing protein n=1 Tax=Aquimarina longa TaxID=1080221 RepID=UPI0007814652|nr:DUF3575 domain-containing protein [Aquimarina longa]